MLSTSLTALEILKTGVFPDQPELLNIVTLNELQSQEFLNVVRTSSELFAEPIKQYHTGKTGAGKTSIGNRLYGHEVMLSTGYMNCTFYVGRLKIPGNLWYFDLPGAGSDEDFENINRAALSLEPLPGTPVTQFEVRDFTHAQLRVLFSLEADFRDAPEADHLLRLLHQGFERHNRALSQKALLEPKGAPHRWLLIDKEYNQTYPVSQEDKRLNIHEAVGVETLQVTTDSWQAAENREEYAPDVVLFVVAAHMIFGRDDKRYLDTLLRVYADKLIVVLNMFTREDVHLATRANIESVTEAISKTYQQVVPGMSPRFVEIDASTGTGLDTVTEQICQILPRKKLGKIQSILQNDLKIVAERERNHRFLSNVNHIAARLALYTVDEKERNQDLIGVAASGIAQYTAMIFEEAAALAEIRHEMDTLIEQEVGKIKKARVKHVFEKTADVETQDILERIPIEEEVEITKMITTKVFKDIVQEVPVSRRERAKIRWEKWKKHATTIFDQLDDLVAGKDETTWSKNAREAYERMYPKKVVGRQEVEEAVPVKDIVKQMTGYEDKVVGTREVVVGYSEKIVGENPLQGGRPVIEFLVGLSLGIRAFCLDTSSNRQVKAYVEDWQKAVRLRLGRFNPQIEEWIQQGTAGEEKLITLLEAELKPLIDISAA